MRTFKHLLILALAALAFTSCGRALTVLITASSNGNPVADVVILVDGVQVATTAADGTATVVLSGNAVSVGMSKKFFNPPAIQNLVFDGAVADLAFEMTPMIFVPDHVSPRIVMLPAVDSDPADYTEITAVDHGGGTYTLTGPTYVYVDYDAGLIYALDTASPTADTALIRMSAFPPAADGSEAVVSTLGTGAVGGGAVQLAVLPDGSVVVTDFEGKRLVQVPSSLSFGSAQFMTTFTYDPTGVTVLPNGKIAFSDAKAAYGPPIQEIDTIADSTPTVLVPLSAGTGTNNARGPTWLQVDPNGLYLYISDTGDDTQAENNSRLIRTTVGGSGWATYGSLGAGVGQFDNPEILGILPDRRLYIMDVSNSRLARIDAGVFDGGAADWVESDAGAGFSFAYWYNYS